MLTIYTSCLLFSTQLQLFTNTAAMNQKRKGRSDSSQHSTLIDLPVRHPTRFDQEQVNLL